MRFIDLLLIIGNVKNRILRCYLDFTIDHFQQKLIISQNFQN